MFKEKKKFYLTTAIPFVNARPHLGFALELIQADVLARHYRAKGYQVFFSTGTDENSLKNVRAAEKEEISTRELCDRNSQYFFNLQKTLNLSFDQFIRTTESRHIASAQKLWSACRPEDIYQKHYQGFYCVGCEAFYKESELVGGLCPEHQTKPELIAEENYFFRLSSYQEKLYQLIESDQYKIIPASRKKEMLSFIKMGLEDFSISRSVERAKGWGVPVPGDSAQIMYVWFDALANYLSVLDFDQDGKLFEKFWPADLHLVGKGIIRFHAIYWPAMLLSAGLPLPKELFVHGYLTIGGEKMSKSSGNVADPYELVETYGTDAVRYYLLKHISPFEDGDFTEEKFQEVYNADLANGLGNLVARVSNLIEKNFSGKINLKPLKTGLEEIDKLVADYQFNEALKLIVAQLSSLDKIIDQEKPWELIKKDKPAAERILAQVAGQIVFIAKKLEIFLPETSQKVIDKFTAKKIKKAEPLFLRK